MTVAALSLLLASVLAFLRVAAKRRSVPAVVALGFFSVIYIARPLMLWAGSPTISRNLFFGVDALIAQAAVVVSIYVLVSFGSFLAFDRLGNAISLAMPAPAGERAWRLMRPAALVLSFLAIAIATWLLARFGSVQGVLQAAKLSKELESTFALRQVPGIGALLCLCLAGRRRSVGNRVGEIFWIVLSVVGLSVFALWGSRLEVFVLISGYICWLALRHDGGIDRSKVALLAIVGAALLSLATYLYVFRLSELAGDWEVATSRDMATTLAVSLHMTRFDSLLLVIQDFLSSGAVRSGEDFANGLYMAVPRSLWAEKPQSLLIGQWFRQVYEPQAINGWTVGAVGEYLLNFGLLGLFVGGLIFGLLLSVAHHYYCRVGVGRVESVLLAFVLVLIVFPEGSIIQMIPRIILWLLPFWLLSLAGRVRVSGSLFTR